jgi:hypothetical protein
MKANEISNTCQRLDMLAPDDRPAIRELFQQYLKVRITVYHVIAAKRDPAHAFDNTERLHARIWTAAVAAVEKPDGQYAAEFVPPAINEMIDVTTEREVAFTTQIPERVPVQLIAISLFCAFLAGTGMSRHGVRHIVHGSTSAAAVALTVYTILDLGTLRGALIRRDAAESVLDALRGSIQPA